MECPSCHAPAGGGLCCQGCGAILPPRELDPFAALGVPRRFDLDVTELEARHRELSRKLHPDRFAKAPPRERLLSLQASTTLNQALKTLKAPMSRAQALLELDGLTIGEQDRAPDELLMEIMELRERLDDAKAANDEQAVAAMVKDVGARREAVVADIASGFASGGDRQAIKEKLIEVRYLDRFLEAGA
jgi:molecular chaperone HscB